MSFDVSDSQSLIPPSPGSVVHAQRSAQPNWTHLFHTAKPGAVFEHRDDDGPLVRVVPQRHPRRPHVRGCVERDREAVPAPGVGVADERPRSGPHRACPGRRRSVVPGAVDHAALLSLQPSELTRTLTALPGSAAGAGPCPFGQGAVGACTAGGRPSARTALMLVVHRSDRSRNFHTPGMSRGVRRCRTGRGRRRSGCLGGRESTADSRIRRRAARRRPGRPRCPVRPRLAAAPLPASDPTAHTTAQPMTMATARTSANSTPWLSQLADRLGAVCRCPRS